MFGTVPASLLLDLARQDGAMFQLELDLDCPPYVFVNPDYLASCITGHSVIQGNGKSISIMGTEDHPYFRDTRNWLAQNGYIHMEKGWTNGDRVIKPFYFNNVYMAVGEQFSCAPAMKYQYGKQELYNNQQPLPVPNYAKDQDEYELWDKEINEVSFPDYVDHVDDEQDDL